MSILFPPIPIRTMEIRNRFVHSSTYEVMADERGEVTCARKDRQGMTLYPVRVNSHFVA